MCVCMCIYLRMYVCVYVYIYVCVCVSSLSDRIFLSSLSSTRVEYVNNSLHLVSDFSQSEKSLTRCKELQKVEDLFLLTGAYGFKQCEHLMIYVVGSYLKYFIIIL